MLRFPSVYATLLMSNFAEHRKIRYRKGDFDMTANEQLASVGKNIQEKATLIWNVANTLFGAFKPHEYGLVILPMVVIKRFHDCLLPTHQAVLDTSEPI